MNLHFSTRRARLSGVRLFAGLWAALTLTLSALAQGGVGSVTGQVSDANNFALLAGATVVIEGTGLQVRTDRSGTFSIPRVPAGSYTAVVSYLGYETKRLPVVVSAGQIAVLNVALGDELVTLREFSVQGIVEGQARALNQQRAAQNITNLISADSFGQFPDASIADAARRLPGVTVVRGAGEGEGRYVTIRGLNADFNAVSLDGVRVSVSNFDGASRSVPLDVVSTKTAETIEVTKALTPDQDADAIGGTIRIRTRSAFDRQGRFASAEGALVYHNLISDYGSGFYLRDTGYRGSVSYGDFVGGDRRWGLSLNASVRNSPYVTQSVDTRGFTTVTGGTANNGGAQYNGLFVPTGVVLQEFFDEIDQNSVNASLEYRPDAASRYRVGGTWSQRDSRRGRQRQEIRFDRSVGFWNLSRPVTVVGDTITEFTSDNRLFRQMRDFYEEQNLYSLVVDGRRQRGDLTIEFRAGYNRGDFDGDPNRDLNASFQTGFADNNYRLVERYFPEFGSTRNRFSPAQYRLVSVDLGTRFITDEEVMFGGDLKWDRELFGGQGFIKIGAQARLRSRDFETVDRFFDDATNVRRLSGGAGAFAWWLDEAPDGGSPATANYGPARTVGGRYDFGFFIDPRRARQIVDHLLANGTLAFNEAGALDSRFRSLAGSYRADEDIYAAYAMAQTRRGPWSVLGGVRLEYTDVRFDTWNAIRGGTFYTGATPISRSNDYLDVLPSFHVRYDATESLVIRAALSSTIARASYRQLNPAEVVNVSERTVSRGRTDLDPTRSTNIDLTADYYFESIGLFSIGGFYKDMSDNIYRLRSEVPGSQIPGTPAADANVLYEVSEFRNARGAEVYGFELAFDRNLRFLPAPFDGLGVFANYTWVDSKVNTGLPERANLKTPLFEQVGRSYNLGAYYEKHGLQVRVAYNWRDSYLAFNGFAADPRLDRYLAATGQLDLTASYALPWFNLTVFGEFNNLTDRPDRAYLGDEATRPAYNEYRDWQATIGLRWRL